MKPNCDEWVKLGMLTTKICDTASQFDSDVYQLVVSNGQTVQLAAGVGQGNDPKFSLRKFKRM